MSPADRDPAGPYASPPAEIAGEAAGLHALAMARLAGMPALPLPGCGDTLGRWRALARLGAEDVTLAKVLEAHYDAIAILAGFGDAPPANGELWAVWAAEPPGATLRFAQNADESAGDRLDDVDGHGCTGRLDGQKAWCSGASLVTHALVTTHEGDDRGLARVALGADGLSAPATQWNAVGMARVVSGTLHFDRVAARRVGTPGAYLSRPGFWHGGAGVAACWHGAACAIAETLRTHPKVEGHAHAAAHLGLIDCNLSAAASLLRELSMQVDAAPALPHVEAVMRLRSFVERVATDTIDRVGRALGAGPLCEDRAHALRCADLTTFIRQSHAESDWEALGKAAHAGVVTWTL